MENYFDLGIRYIKHNKRRNILTACGVMAVIIVNGSYSMFSDDDDIREYVSMINSFRNVIVAIYHCTTIL